MRIVSIRSSNRRTFDLLFLLSFLPSRFHLFSSLAPVKRSRLSHLKQKKYSEVSKSNKYLKGRSRLYDKELGRKRSGCWLSEASPFGDRKHRNTYFAAIIPVTSYYEVRFSVLLGKQIRIRTREWHEQETYNTSQ